MSTDYGNKPKAAKEFMGACGKLGPGRAWQDGNWEEEFLELHKVLDTAKHRWETPKLFPFNTCYIHIQSNVFLIPRLLRP